MSAKKSPFDDLSDEMKKVTIDIAFLMTSLAQRLPPASEKLQELVSEHFTRTYSLPNSAKYALRHALDQLWTSDWEATVTKRGLRLITRFEPMQGGNGEARIKTSSQ
jgi:hypothetical protein